MVAGVDVLASGVACAFARSGVCASIITPITATGTTSRLPKRLIASVPISGLLVVPPQLHSCVN
jgi:hypothetical protein